MNLIEILIVCAIIGILAGISIPLWRSFQPKLALNRACQELITAIREKQQQAITKNTNQIFDFAQVVLPEEVSFQEINFTEQKIIFLPNGSVQESGNAILKADNNTAKINVSVSGYVKKEY